MSLIPSTSLCHDAADGVSLIIDRYDAAKQSRAHVLVVHGYLEHAGRYQRLAHALTSQGLDCSVLELRGHGRSGGPRAHVSRFARYVEDVAEVLALLRPSTDGKPMFVLGHSLGGLIVSHAAQAYGASLHGVLLTNPYLQNAVKIPLAKQWLGRVAHRVAPRLKAPAGLKREWMSRDPRALDDMVHDDAIQRFATAGWFHEVSLAQQRAATFHQWACPLWLGIGDADPVALPEANRAFAAQLSTPQTTVKVYAHALHELLQDVVAEEVTQDMVAWIGERIS